MGTTDELDIVPAARLVHLGRRFRPGFAYVKVDLITCRIGDEKISVGQFAALMRRQATEPVYLTNLGPKRLWLYKGLVYSASSVLSVPEVEQAASSRSSPANDSNFEA